MFFKKALFYIGHDILELISVVLNREVETDEGSTPEVLAIEGSSTAEVLATEMGEDIHNNGSS